jgi:hypothetical protein
MYSINLSPLQVAKLTEFGFLFLNFKYTHIEKHSYLYTTDDKISITAAHPQSFVQYAERKQKAGPYTYPMRQWGNLKHKNFDNNTQEKSPFAC